MLTLKQLKQESETTKTIDAITQALGDIATSKLQATRKTVEQNIRFFHEIANVYRIVKSLAVKHKFYEKFLKSKNGKTVVLLLTSNYHFNGGLDSQVSRFFIDNTIKLDCDRIVVGVLGKDYLISHKYPFNYQFIQFKKDYPSLDELRNLSNIVFQYSKILVFHTKFVTVLNQTPTVTDITGSDLGISESQAQITYIVEPEIEQMTKFFETQILILLFQAVFLEVDIARLAARMIAMNQAQDNSKKELAIQRRMFLQVRKQILNNEILETYSGILKNS